MRTMPDKDRSSRRFALALIGLLLLSACATPLRRAIENGDAARVSALLDQGAEKKEPRVAGVTLLKAAVNARRPEIVKLLIARGAKINERLDGASALTAAATNGDLEMVKLLIAEGAAVSKADSFWVQGKDKTAIIELLQSTWDVQRASATANAQTAAHEAAVKLIAEAGLLPAAALPAETAAAVPRGEHADDFALIVGVDKYQDAPEARFAEDDAAAVRDRLIKLGWPSRNVLTLTGPRAGRAGLERYLEQWLPANARADSKFFFYFAGDGAVDAKTGIAYILPWDADAGMLEQTGYPLPLLRRRLGALGPRGAAAVIDAGFSGTGERASAAPGGKAAPAVSADAAAGEDRGDVFLASAPDETVGVIEMSGSGLFTETFLNALAAAPSGPLDLRALFADVQARVSQQARLQGRRQTPRVLAGAPQEPGLQLR